MCIRDRFNDDISDWDVLNVNNMNSIFAFATDFNQDISEWDVSSVTDMAWMFHGASNFNGDLSNWDVSSVTYMNAMFYNAEDFNQDISEWDVSSVTSNAMNQMFDGADDLSDDNKCAIHSSFDSNENWPYDWEEYCQSFQPEDRDELKDAVDEWIDDSDSANSTYGTIDTWDTSLITCLLYTSPSPRDLSTSRMPSSA